MKQCNEGVGTCATGLAIVTPLSRQYMPERTEHMLYHGTPSELRFCILETGSLLPSAVQEGTGYQMLSSWQVQEMSHSSPVIQQSKLTGTPFASLPQMCYSSVLAPLIWNAAWGRSACWLSSLVGGLCLLSSQARSTCVTMCTSLARDPGIYLFTAVRPRTAMAANMTMQLAVGCVASLSLLLISSCPVVFSILSHFALFFSTQHATSLAYLLGQ